MVLPRLRQRWRPRGELGSFAVAPEDERDGRLIRYGVPSWAVAFYRGQGSRGRGGLVAGYLVLVVFSALGVYLWLT